jgi:hypothetical protein
LRAGIASALCWPALAFAQPVQALLRAYPEQLAAISGDDLIWRDGTIMTLGSHTATEDVAEMLHHGTILDQFFWKYPIGEELADSGADPGRIRNRAFFDKMYGDCKRGEVAPKLVSVTWLPATWGHRVQVTSVNGVANQLEAVSRALDALPAEVKRPLYPAGGTYVCRAVRDTGEPSMHGWGAAIDINPAATSYWMWGARKRTELDHEVISIFEAHGFIWGGKWAHFDTMHFEYRPELLER